MTAGPQLSPEGWVSAVLTSARCEWEQKKEGIVSTKIHRLTDLFEEGVTLPLRTTNGDLVAIWVNKLTPFEQEEANQEGRIARARAILAIKEIGTPEYDLFRVGIEGIKSFAIIESLLATNANRYISEAVTKLRSEEEWRERLEVIQFSDDQVRDKGPDDPEVLLLDKIVREYTDEMAKRTEEARNDQRIELGALSEEDLREQYRLAYVTERGMAAFTAEQQKAQVYFALRRCDATQREDKTWDHSPCDHGQRWLTNRAEATTLPQGLLDQFRSAYIEVAMAPDAARFSEGPASSSASSGPSSKQADSEASGPEEMSVEPAGISS